MRKVTKNGLIKMNEVLRYEIENKSTKEKFYVNGARKKEYTFNPNYTIKAKLIWIEV